MKSFEYELSALGLDVYLVDHSDLEGSASSFAPDGNNIALFGRVDNQISSAKDNVHRGFLGHVLKAPKGLAIIQVDVVGHSMGGLIARARTVAKGSGISYFRPGNAGHGDFHKIITIGTPHRGTALADTLVKNNCETATITYCLFIYDFTCLEWKPTLQELFANKLEKPIGPAVVGFQTGSTPIQNIGATTVPSFAVVGIAPDKSDTEANLNMLIRLFKVGATVDSLLGGNGGHDTIVPLSSQTGGIVPTASSQITGIVHANAEADDKLSGGLNPENDINETQSSEVYNRVKTMLFAPAQSSFDYFAALKPGSGTYNSLKQCDSSSSPQSAKVVQALASVADTPSITLLPASGTVVRPGQVVTLQFDVAGGVPAQEGLFAVNGALRRLSGAPPYLIDYTVPNRAGLIDTEANQAT